MEILIVVGTLSGIGGIETCVRTLAEEAREHGDRVRVLALTPSLLDGRWHEGLQYAEVHNGHPSLKWQALRGLPAVIKACRENPPDVVLVVYGSTIPIARAALWLARLKRPVMAWLHFSTVHAQRLGLLRFAHGHLCISSQIAKATRELPGIDADNVHLVFNGASFRAARAVPRSTHGPLRLMHVGRLMMGGQKRTDDLLRALAQVEGDWQLDVVGRAEGEQHMTELRALADRLGISPRVRWLGWQEDPWQAIGQADLLVMCSSFEGFPMVLIEAMARGIPCLSTDCPSGPADIIRPGYNGWLYDVGDELALAHRLQELVHDRRLLPHPSQVSDSARPFSSDSMFTRARQAMQATMRRFARPSRA